MTGRLFGLDSTNGGLFSNPDRLRARFALPFLPDAVSAACGSRSSFGRNSGSANTILGVGLEPRDGKGEDTACALSGTGGTPSVLLELDIGRPRPRLKLLTFRNRRLDEESRDRDREVERLRLSVLLSDDWRTGCELCFVGFRGLDGVTTMSRGTSGRALLSYGRGGSGLSEEVREAESREGGSEYLSSCISADSFDGGVSLDRRVVSGVAKGSRSLAVRPNVRSENGWDWDQDPAPKVDLPVGEEHLLLYHATCPRHPKTVFPTNRPS